MEREDEVPGVTFTVEAANLLPPPRQSDPNVVAAGRVVLRAVVNNLDTWKEAVEKLRDLRIYTVEDLTTELIEINQERARRAEETLARVIQAKDAEIAVLKQQASFTMAFSAYRHIEAIQNTIAGVPELVQKFITDCDKLLDGQKPR